MRTLIAAIAAALPLTLAASIALAQQPDLGVAPVMLTQSSYVFDTAEQHKIRVVVVAKGLNHPFAIALLPNGDALVSERGGKLRRVRNVGGAATLDAAEIKGVPTLTPAYRNGGLHDLALHPQFAQNGFVYFTFNKAGKAGDPKATPPTRQESLVSLLRAKLVGDALTDVQELFVGPSGSTSGSRVAFGKDGFVYMTTGGPFGPDAQRVDSIYGKVLRFTADGKVPADNPFVGRKDARPEVFSYGHRDSLGLTVHPVTGAILQAEHGPNGGDEVNSILPGRNYGWPKYTFGRNYDGPHFPDPPIAQGIEDPLILWVPSIGPSGMTVYTGDKFPAWKNNIFVGSVRWGEIPRTGSLQRVVVTEKLDELRRESLLGELHQRIRDVRQGADGLLYLLTDEDDGALLRIEPAG